MTTSEEPFTLIKAPDGSCWGKWFLPVGTKDVSECGGMHISKFRFGGFYEEIPNPRLADYASKEAYHVAKTKYLEECQAEGVEMIFAKEKPTDAIPSIIFLRPCPEV
jgi:hypothetical protein